MARGRSVKGKSAQVSTKHVPDTAKADIADRIRRRVPAAADTRRTVGRGSRTRRGSRVRSRWQAASVDPVGRILAPPAPRLEGYAIRSGRQGLAGSLEDPFIHLGAKAEPFREESIENGTDLRDQACALGLDKDGCGPEHLEPKSRARSRAARSSRMSQASRNSMPRDRTSLSPAPRGSAETRASGGRPRGWTSTQSGSAVPWYVPRRRRQAERRFGRRALGGLAVDRPSQGRQWRWRRL